MTFLVQETLGKSLTKQYGRTDNNGNIAMIIPIYTEKLELRKRVSISHLPQSRNKNLLNVNKIHMLCKHIRNNRY